MDVLETLLLLEILQLLLLLVAAWGKATQSNRPTSRSTRIISEFATILARIVCSWTPRPGCMGEATDSGHRRALHPHYILINDEIGPLVDVERASCWLPVLVVLQIVVNTIVAWLLVFLLRRKPSGSLMD